MSMDQLKNIPEVEVLAQREPKITPQRVARKLTVTIAKIGLFDRLARKGILPTQEVQDIVTELKTSSDGGTAWQMVLDHTLPLGNRLMLLANRRVHPDMWMRDFAYTAEFTDTPTLDENVLNTFESKQKPNGQIPTAVGILGQTPWHFADDESTLLYIITAAQLASREGGRLSQARIDHIDAAYHFISQHVHNGMYVTPQGDRRGWLDAFKYPQADVITQNQGLYAVALLAAAHLGINVKAAEVKTASNLYRDMAEPSGGFLPLSARFSQAPDISTLYPEYLAMTRWADPLLSDKVIGATLDRTPKSSHGYKVLTASPIGEYFDPKYFVTEYTQGKYQNGGMWHLWHNNALVVGQLHGLVTPEQYQPAVMSQLAENNWPESLRTGGEYEDTPTPENLYQVWDAAIPAQHRIVNLQTGFPMFH